MIDADKMGHLAYAKGTPCLQALVEHFGSSILDSITGTVDRKVLGGLVFSDPEHMKALNCIVWPAIRVLLQEEIARVKQQARCEDQTDEGPTEHANEEEGEKEGKGLGSASGKVIVVEAAVLLEAGWTDLVDEVWAGKSFYPNTWIYIITLHDVVHDGVS